MGRNPSNHKEKLRKGLWSPEEDEKLYNHIIRFGVGCWSNVPKQAGTFNFSPSRKTVTVYSPVLFIYDGRILFQVYKDVERAAG